MRPLSDLLVLDFSTLLPGPMATLMLAEAGAEVIKVERPGSGDDMRRFEPSWGADSAVFALLNRGKKSLALDLKNTADRERLRPLLERADIVVEQFRPGVMERLGVDYSAVAKLNPGVIYCSISAYGQTGPRRLVPGHDLNLMAETGFLSLSMGDPSDAVIPPTPIADIAGGAYPAVMNIMLALRARERSGTGCYLDISLGDNLFPLTYWALAMGWGGGHWPGNGAGLPVGGTPRYRIYGTRDGKAIAAAPLERPFWENFCKAVDLPPELRDDRRDPAATLAAVQRIIASEDADTWMRRFAGSECCCSLVVDLPTAIADPQFQSRDLFGQQVANENGLTMPALPVPLAPAFRPPAGTVLASPSVGCSQAMLNGASMAAKPGHD